MGPHCIIYTKHKDILKFYCQYTTQELNLNLWCGYVKICAPQIYKWPKVMSLRQTPKITNVPNNRNSKHLLLEYAFVPADKFIQFLTYIPGQAFSFLFSLELSLTRIDSDRPFRSAFPLSTSLIPPSLSTYLTLLLLYTLPCIPTSLWIS